MPMMRTQYDDLFFSRLPYLREIFFEEFGEPDAMFERVFNMEGSSRMREQTTGVTGFQLPSAKPEGEVIDYDTLLQAYSKTFTHTTYALGFQITEEAFEDDIDGPLKRGGIALGRSMRTGKNTVVWNVFNNSFSTEQAGDGVSVFNNSHPLIEGGTFDNLVTGDFGLAVLETALNIFADMRDERNLLIDMEPSLIVHPPELRWVVGQVLGSPDKPDTASRSTNVMYDILDPIMVKWLTGSTDWFIGVRPGQHALTLWNRRELRTASDTDFDTGNGKTKASHRHSQGFSDWRGWVGGQAA